MVAGMSSLDISRWGGSSDEPPWTPPSWGAHEKDAREKDEVKDPKGKIVIPGHDFESNDLKRGLKW